MNNRSQIACLILVCAAGARAEPFVTKDNQTSNNCNLIVNVGGLPDWRAFSVTIPKDNPLPKGICDVYLVVGLDGSFTNCRAIAPLAIHETRDGSRAVEIYVGPDLLKDAFLRFGYLASPIAPPQCMYLKLDSYADDKRNTNRANQVSEVTPRKFGEPQR